MTLNKQDVDNIANLSKITIDESMVGEYIENLNNILKFVEQMQQINTDDIEPLSNPNNQTQRLRKDEVTQENKRDKYQQVAPKVDCGLYLVPKVIE